MNNYNLLFSVNSNESFRPRSPSTNNFFTGPLEPNGKSWKEIRNEQRAAKLAAQKAKNAPKPTLRMPGLKFANTKKTLTRSANGSRNLLTRSRKQRKQRTRKQRTRKQRK